VFQKAHVIAFAGHCGGSGTTTAVMTIAWQWGKKGKKVAVLDLTSSQNTLLLALDDSMNCLWKNVTILTNVEDLSHSIYQFDYVLIDFSYLPRNSPNISPEIWPLIDSLVVSMKPDLVSLRTLPNLEESIRTIIRGYPQIKFLGIFFNCWNPKNAIACEIIDSVYEFPKIFLPVAIEECIQIQNWCLNAGLDVPYGLASQAYEELGQLLQRKIEGKKSKRLSFTLPYIALSPRKAMTYMWVASFLHIIVTTVYAFYYIWSLDQP
jgi:cellulose biosynthesis protein BcsQ